MPKTPKIAKLPPAVRREIEERLTANGFGDYAAMETELRRRGWHIGKSSLHRWGMKLKQIQREADAAAYAARAGLGARQTSPNKVQS